MNCRIDQQADIHLKLLGRGNGEFIHDTTEEQLAKLLQQGFVSIQLLGPYNSLLSQKVVTVCSLLSFVLQTQQLKGVSLYAACICMLPVCTLYATFTQYME